MALLEWAGDQIVQGRQPDSLKDVLDKATSLPAPKLFHHAPRQPEQRIAELVRDAMHEHADAELEAKRHSSQEVDAKAKFKGQRLWVMAPMLLAVLQDNYTRR